MGQQIIWKEQKACEWIIEEPEIFTNCIQELRNQINGMDGNFTVSEKEDILSISKVAELIINPLEVNINDKKILTKVYSELERIACQEEIYLDTQELLSKISGYLMQLEQNSSFILEIDENIDLVAIFKATGVKLAQYADGFWETLIQYVKVVAEIAMKKIIIFVNLRSYVTEKQLEELLLQASYDEVYLLFIENVQRDCHDGIIRYIIDKDGCEI